MRSRSAGWLAMLVLAAGCSASRSVERASPTPPPAPSTTSVSTPVATSSAPRPTPTTSARSTAAVPPVSAKARAAGLLDIRTIVPDAIVDLRYGTPHNFTGIRLYPRDARCLVHRSMAAGLRTAAARLRHQGYLLVFWDCYRPHAVQVRMFKIVPNPEWVARPGPYATSHEAGRSVDVTLATRAQRPTCSIGRVDGHCLLDMGTGFDDFTPRAHAFATDGVSGRAQADRALLRNAMNAGGLQVYVGEWWHFDGPGAGVHRPILDAPVS